MRKVYLPLCLSVFACINAQQFKEVMPPAFKNFFFGRVAIADFNNDGYKDLFFTGTVDENNNNLPDYSFNTFYKNTNGTFSPLQSFRENSAYLGDAKFIDFDNDGLLDLIATGLSSDEHRTLRWKNTGDAFVLDNISDGRIRGNIESFDLNHDGLLDYAVNGFQYKDIGGVNYKTDLYINSKSGFSDANNETIPLGSLNGKLRIFDINNDGLHDAVIFGTTASGTSEKTFTVYKNDNGVFNTHQQLEGLVNGDLAYADFNADGYLDMIACGKDKNNNYHLIYYKNDSAGKFLKKEISTEYLDNSSLDVGDINDDGYYDFIVIGSGSSASNTTKVFVYNSSSDTFEYTDYGIPQLGGNGGIKLFDFNNDNKLDILMYGANNKETDKPHKTKLLENTQDITNNAPNPPANLSSSLSDNKILFEWNGANDDKTPSKALQYEFIVGSAPGKSDIAKYTVTTPHWFLQKENLPNTIYWRVKSIDASKVLSNDSEEKVVSNLSVNNITKESGAVLYPNPVKDVLNIRTEAKVKSYRITNTSGQVVLSKTTDEKSINLSGLSKGLYIVEITFEDAKPLSAKIIIN